MAGHKKNTFSSRLDISEKIDQLVYYLIQIGSGNLDIKFPKALKQGKLKFLILAIEHMVLKLRDARMEMKRLIRELSRLAAFPGQNPFPVIETDLTGKVTYLNPASKSHMPDLDVGISKHPLLESLPRVVALLKKEKKKIHVQEISLANRIYEQQISYIPEVDRIRFYLFDRTDKKLLEEMERLDKIKDEFIGTVSHEIRTPLSTIQASVGNLRDKVAGALTPRQMKVIEITDRNIHRLNRIINDLLDISRLESGKIKMRYGCFDVLKIAQEIIQSFKSLAHERGIILEIEPRQGDLPFLNADVDKFVQVLTNLVDNALRYAQKKVIVQAKREGASIVMSVCDDGAGIIEEDKKYLFTKFCQIGRPYGGAGYKGTGLGLAICKSIVELHGGKIWVDSMVGQGTRFYYTFPIKGLMEKEMSVEKKVAQERKSERPLILNTVPKEQTQKKILIIDDEGDLTDMLTLGLEYAGFLVDVASDGKVGLRKAASLEPDLILLDIVMPELDGWEVCKQLKAHSATKGIPVIFITVLRSEDMETRAREAGANRVVYM